MISVAKSDTERQGVLRLFLDTFDDIASDAVPMNFADHVFAPTVLQAHDPDTEQLVAGALSCRPYLAAYASAFPQTQTPRLVRNIDRIRELDLVAVRPDIRCRGLGTKLLEFMECDLAIRGVRAWFGCATENLDVVRLRAFYARRGFVVLERGEPPPPLLGQQWVLPTTEEPAFYFWKKIQPIAPPRRP